MNATIFTKPAVKKSMNAAGVGTDTFKLCSSGRDLHVELTNRTQANKVAKALGLKAAPWHKTGYGSFVFFPNGYQAAYSEDYCNA